jgi:hypothetical protein
MYLSNWKENLINFAGLLSLGHFFRLYAVTLFSSSNVSGEIVTYLKALIVISPEQNAKIIEHVTF